MTYFYPPEATFRKACRGLVLPVLGQGACFMGERAETVNTEKAALMRGLSLGMNLVDTAEIYGDGGSERLIGDMLRGRLFNRGDVILMTKVHPCNASPPSLYESCDNSLLRLGTDHIDIYLLHWRDVSVPLDTIVYGMEELKRRGKILHWGVSNFDVSDMEELFKLSNGSSCAVNQVLYHLGSRGIEYDLLTWLHSHDVAMVAYCPLAQGGRLRRTSIDFSSNAALCAVAEKYNTSIFQIMLAFVLRIKKICAIPKAASIAHIEENAAAPALAMAITPGDWAALDDVFLPPTAKMHLDME